MDTLFITNLFSKVVQAFCWMLIHSLWQGLLFTVATGIVMIVTTRSVARLRYNILSVLFFLFIALCGFTFIWELGYSKGQATIFLSGTPVDVNEHSLPYLFNRFIGFYSSNTSLIALLWFNVFCFKGIKMITALVYNSRVKHHKINIPPTLWKSTIERLCARLQIKKTVGLFESEMVKIPIVIGHLKPIIFIPVGLLTNLPAGEVEAILLHELAHIRRNDYLINVIQLIAESIFFFNPALLWMSAVLREERENCCDDVAINETKSKKQFIQALISFREHAPHATSYATAFPARKNQLLKRVSRIIHNRNNTLDAVDKTFFVASFVLLVFLSFAATNTGTALPANTMKKEAVALHQIPVVSDPLAANKILVNNTEPTFAIVAKEDNVKSNYNRHRSTQSARPKQVITEAYSETIINTADFVESDKMQAKLYVESTPDYNQQAERYRQQVEQDRVQADKDRRQAALDRIQAQKDREQALKDMKQAELDRQQADKDRKQAQKDRELAEKERLSLQANN